MSVTLRATKAVKRMTAKQLRSFARLGFAHFLEESLNSQHEPVEQKILRQRKNSPFKRTNDFASRVPQNPLMSRFDSIMSWLNNDAMCLLETVDGAWVLCHMDDVQEIEARLL